MYLALYRKYRSQTFDEVISQEHITTTLKNQVKSGKLAHAYLFTGSRGTGKTSCAKLLAKAVNCLSSEDGNPCGECENCKAISEGCSDITEMDAASNNSVDDVRALRDEVMYSPVTCKYRVYIIDEVHMLSASAFNALLKTIEEPPPHVIFILATTEVHKVPATILSRCQQFSFRRIAVEDSAARLCEIAEKENAQLEYSAAELISRLSDGGMRDAVSLLDQCISVSRDIDEKVVRDTAGVAGVDHLFSLADCIADKNSAAALKILDELHYASKDLVLLMEEMTSHLRNLMMLRAMNMDFSLIPAGSGDKNRLAQQAERFTTGEIIRCIEILQDTCAKAGKATRRKTLAEMCFIKLCNPRLDSDEKVFSLRLEKLEEKVDKLTSQPVVMPRGTAQEVAIPQPKTTAADIIEINSSKTSVSEIKEKSDNKALQQEAKPMTNESEPPSWLFEGDDIAPPSEYDEYPPFDVQISSEDDISNSNETSLEEQPPFDIDEKQSFEYKENEETPPFDIYDSQKTAVTEPPTSKAYEPPDISVSSGEWIEIISELPDFLKALLKDVKSGFTDTNIVLYGYSPFLVEFLKKGDSVMRIEAAAEKVTGKKLRLIFGDGSNPQEQEKSDRATDFIKKAENMGVKIKYKRK